MPVSELKLIKHCVEYLPQSDILRIPRNTRGIYVLFEKHSGDKFNVVYVGMAGGEKAGIQGRIRSHQRRKGNLWTHFSAFEVWDNIREEEVRELEGLFRHIYRKDKRANRLNRQRGFKKLVKIRRATKWLRKEKKRKFQSTT
jgi:hypothetical protein